MSLLLAIYRKIPNISPGLIDIFNHILGGLYSGGLIFGRKFVLVSRGAYILDFTVFSRSTLLMTALSLLFNVDLQINIVVSQYLHTTFKDRVIVMVIYHYNNLKVARCLFP